MVLKAPSLQTAGEMHVIHIINMNIIEGLNLNTICNLPDWFKCGVEAESLKLSGCAKLTDIFVEYENGRFHGLTHLYACGVDNDYENSLTWVPGKAVWKNLQVLELDKVDCQELCVVELAPGSVFSLRCLSVQYCYNWGNVLLPSTLLQRLENLQVLECFCTKKIEYLFQCNGILEPKQSKLRHIKCADLVAVRSICDGPAPPALFQNRHSL